MSASTARPRIRFALFILMLAMVAEGLDLVVASFVFPRVMEEWGTSIEDITLLVTLSVVAGAIGGYLAGPLADRFGCRPVILVCALEFSVLTIATAAAPGLAGLMIVRLAACVGLGALVPVVIAQVAELVPERSRSHMVSLVWSGGAFGFILGSLLAAVIIPAAGWRTLVIVSGGLSLVLVPFLLRVLPRRAERLDDPAPVAADDKRTAVGTLFARRYLASTILTWICFAVGLGVAYLIATYLPLMVERYGLGSGSAALVTGLFGLCGLLGQLGHGFALRRWDPRSVLAVIWGVGTAGIVLLAVVDLGIGGFLAAICAIAFTIAGSNAVLPTLATALYPARANATGVSWANGAGQIGRLGGGWAGGAMLAAGLSTPQLFLGIAVPTVAGIVAAVLLRRARRTAEAAEDGALSPAMQTPVGSETLASEARS
ncbi:MFS transporter [Microbacterium azadirachtae]|uniref:4-hydroxybenzoate transporter PcaK n=1 Tax=Microbacterium azadirachtae TaxID=582680 RepID=A0A0F0LMT3_9MICO|nr:MFS transporter [Microbacterium azadirachtae]KJL34537.1 4-hydroxybenzoate transporter PcaK [Microbacterium azadirachtae]